MSKLKHKVRVHVIVTGVAVYRCDDCGRLAPGRPSSLVETGTEICASFCDRPQGWTTEYGYQFGATNDKHWCTECAAKHPPKSSYESYVFSPPAPYVPPPSRGPGVERPKGQPARGDPPPPLPEVQVSPSMALVAQDYDGE